MTYAIRATEGWYSGLHGVEDLVILEDSTLEIAKEVGHEMSQELIYSFGLDDNFQDVEDSEEWAENIEYEIWEITDTCGLPVDKLKDEFIDDYETFVQNHCIKVF